MADNTVAGIVGIVAIVLITALFFIANAGTSERSALTGNAVIEASGAEPACDAKRFCDGTKLVIVREDCSTATAFCRDGCLKESGVCA